MIVVCINDCGFYGNDCVILFFCVVVDCFNILNNIKVCIDLIIVVQDGLFFGFGMVCIIVVKQIYVLFVFFDLSGGVGISLVFGLQGDIFLVSNLMLKSEDLIGVLVISSGFFGVLMILVFGVLEGSELIFVLQFVVIVLLIMFVILFVMVIL